MESLRCDGAKVRCARVQAGGAMVRSGGPTSNLDWTSALTIGPSHWTVAPSTRRPIGPLVVFTIE